MRRLAVAAVVLLAGVSSALAQAFPTKPVRILVGAAAGGGNDTVARIIAQYMPDGLGQPVVVENKTGASQMIAAEAVAKSPPDGYTLMLATQAALVVAPILYRTTAYDPLKDFAGVVLIGSTPMILVAGPGLPARSFAELVTLAKAKPGEIDYASGGVGTTPHMAGELLGAMAKLKLTHVAYKGEQPALTDIIGGHVQMMFANLPAALPHVAAGTLRPLAVSTPARLAVAPTVPTVAESGLAGFDVQTWFGMVAPAATPPEILARLNAEVLRIIALAEVRERLAAQGLDPIGSAPAAFTAHIRAEHAKYAKVIQEAGIKAE